MSMPAPHQDNDAGVTAARSSSSTAAPGHAPRLSVVLSYYNLASYLSDAIESIRRQTFADYELLLLDDGSTDDSPRIATLHAQQDSRVRILRSEQNRGIPATLNAGLRAANAEWIALMDGDDVALPNRFERQLAYLGAHPNLAVVGCFPLMVDTVGDPIGTPDIYYEHHEDIERTLLDGHGWAFLQPTAIMRRDVALQIGGYREDLTTSMDLDFFLRVAEVGRIANVPEVLYHYRMRARSVTHDRGRAQRERHERVLRDAYLRRHIERAVPTTDPAQDALEPADHHLKWGWWALKNKHVRTARRQALCALRLRPWSTACWKLVACSLRGH